MIKWDNEFYKKIELMEEQEFQRENELVNCEPFETIDDNGKIIVKIQVERYKKEIWERIV